MKATLCYCKKKGASCTRSVNSRLYADLNKRRKWRKDQRFVDVILEPLLEKSQFLSRQVLLSFGWSTVKEG